jgi:hypothetical protein
LGYSPDDPDRHATTHHVKIDSLQYLKDESEAYRAFNAANHFHYRGTFWNEGKRQVMVRYLQLVAIGIIQGSIAYFTNVVSHVFIEVRICRRSLILCFFCSLFVRNVLMF